jgi:hypothetical protein
MPNKISISNDIALPVLQPPCVFTAHSYLGPTPPALPPPIAVNIGLATEIPVPMFWPPGMGMGQNKLTTTVVHKGLSIVQAGHDCGTCIIHVQILPGPLNTLTLLHIPFSSRKINFSTSSVQAQGKPIACATMISWPPAPMTVCMEPVSPPLSSAPTSHLNTVVVTMTWGDIILGWGTIAVNMLLEYVFYKAGGPASSPGNVLSDLWGAFGKKALGSALGGGSPGEWLAKQAVAVGTGLARLALTDGAADVKISVGSPFFGGEAGVTRDANGNYGVVAGARSANRSGEVSHDSTGSHWKKEQGGMSTTTSQTEQGSQPDSSYSTDTGSWGAPL